MHFLVHSATSRPLTWLVTLLCATAGFGYALSFLSIRTDGAAIHPSDNPVIEQCARDRDQFDDQERLLLLISGQGTDTPVASAKGFHLLKSLHDDAGSLDGIDSERIRSIASVQRVSVSHGLVSVGGFLDSIPTVTSEFQELVRELREESFVDGLLLSQDGLHAVIELPLVPEAHGSSVIPMLESWISTRDTPGYTLRLLGPKLAEASLGDTVLADLSRLVPFLLVAVGVLLFVAFRTIAGVILPLIEAGVVLVWTFGFMAIFNVPVTLATTILPVILLAVAITDEIHLLERLHESANRVEQESSHTDHRLSPSLVVKAFGDVRRPIVWSSLTTSIGLLSFLTATVVPMQHFGLFAGLGIVLAMLFSATLIPAIAVVVPVDWFRQRRRAVIPGHQGTVQSGRTTSQTRIGMIVVVLCLVVGSIPGILQLEVQDAWVDNFNSRSPLATADHDFNSAFWGSYMLDLVFEGSPGYFESAAGVTLLDRVVDHAQSAPHAGGVVSHVLPLRQLSQRMGGDRQLSRLSEGRLAELSLLASMHSGPAGVQEFVTPDASTARVRIAVRSANYQRTRELQDFLTDALPGLVSTDPVSVHLSGDLQEATEVVHAIVTNQIRSLGGTLIGIAILLLFVYPRGRNGMIVLIPVVTAAVLPFGLMGYSGIPLGVATSMFAGLMIAIGVDFALFFYHAYRRFRLTGHDHNGAIDMTHASSGWAVRWNAIVLIAGFAVLVTSKLPPNRFLGLLLVVAICSCFLSTRILLPPLLKRLSLGVLFCVLAQQTVAVAESSPNDTPQQPTAASIMDQLDRSFRARPRAVRMDFVTEFRNQDATIKRTIWGVLNGNPVDTRSLYVVTEPQPLQGTSLLFHDSAGTTATDSIWLNLPSFHTFYAIVGPLQAATLSGTALSYEDARGFISTEYYDFEPGPAMDAAVDPSIASIIARPKTQDIRNTVGYGQLNITVDTVAHFIRHIDFTNRFGQPFKTYDVRESIVHEGVTYPTHAEVTLLQWDIHSDVHYSYWWLTTQPPPYTFHPSIEKADFLTRLIEALAVEGIEPEEILDSKK